MIDFNANKYAREQDNVKKISKLSKAFITEFQIKSRQYAQYQRKYFRSKFRYFLWKELTTPVKEKSPIIQEVYDDIMLTPDQFLQKVIAPSNLEYKTHKAFNIFSIISQHANPSDTRKHAPYSDRQMDNLLIQYVIKKLMPKVATMEKIKIFENIQ